MDCQLQFECFKHLKAQLPTACFLREGLESKIQLVLSNDLQKMSIDYHEHVRADAIKGTLSSGSEEVDGKEEDIISLQS